MFSTFFFFFFAGVYTSSSVQAAHLFGNFSEARHFLG